MEVINLQRSIIFVITSSFGVESRTSWKVMEVYRKSWKVMEPDEKFCLSDQVLPRGVSKLLETAHSGLD